MVHAHKISPPHGIEGSASLLKLTQKSCISFMITERNSVGFAKEYEGLKFRWSLFVALKVIS
jgi:hypothetical protein